VVRLDVVLYPVHEMVLEGSFDDLVKEVWGDELVDKCW
jgi:hypothetical protein